MTSTDRQCPLPRNHVRPLAGEKTGSSESVGWRLGKVIPTAKNSTPSQSRFQAGTTSSGLPAPGGVDDSSASCGSDDGAGSNTAVTVSRREPMRDATNQQRESALTNSSTSHVTSLSQEYLPQHSNTRSINIRMLDTNTNETVHPNALHINETQNSSPTVSTANTREKSQIVDLDRQTPTPPRSLEDQLMESLGMRMDEESYEQSQNRLNQLIDQIEEAMRSRLRTQVPHSHSTTHEPNTNPSRQERRTALRTGRRNKDTKASIKVASLNIRGYGPNENLEDNKNKWNYINQFVRQKRIGVLLVQETHMDESRRQKIQDKFSKRLVLRCSSNPDSPRAKGGVAIVLNKDLVDTSVLDETEVVPGRALLIRMHWHRDRNLKILVVYAPNVSGSDGKDNKEFWETLREYFDRNPSKRPDILAGDMNMVEAGVIDRLPARDDPEDAVEALDELKMSTQLRDGWRDTYPDTKAYTFHQTATGSQSRIDRIYATDAILTASREWKIEPTGVPGADHWMVSVLASHTDAPTIGRGRWAIPRHIIKDKTFMQYTLKRGLETDSEMNKIHTLGRTADRNAQLTWYRYKKDILEVARQRQRIVMPRLEKQLEELKGKLEQINNDQSLTEEERVELSATLTNDITVLERKQFQNTRTDTATRNRIEGEQISRYWSNLNKERKPRDVIYALRREEPGPDGWFETSPEGMAKRARDYHEGLQKEGQATDAEHQRMKQAMTDRVLSNLNTRLTEEQKTYLAMKCDRSDVVIALLSAKNYTSPGIDGATHELWKALYSRYVEDTRAGRPAFDIANLMTQAFNDIAMNGVITDTHFADGWMCPLYKKNDKCEIANYRPITLLNTDYKIFTKVLATKLGKVAPDLLHHNQAGFVPGRQISDQTKLIRMVMASAEQNGQNGLIISLDQEKAYDKVDHDYLWKTLEKFEFPKEFIETVQRLYKTAKTSVMINGIQSETYEVIRGVRQGDPLSCLIFDLAIEPLAAMLRNSHLQGFRIPGITERLIANLFADDTTVFLAASDDFKDLQDILDQWCMASTAKFNVNKTSIIPIGTEEYRQRVTSTRRTIVYQYGTNPYLNVLPPNLHIAREGEAVRILGAWYGNKIDATQIWAPTIEKIDRVLERWAKGSPTMEGRRLITQMFAGGMSQYLTQVQGMPPEVEKRLAKRVSKYIWDEKEKNPVNKDATYLRINEGGRAVLDIPARNEAIELMWLKRYLSFGPDRPLWAVIADSLLATNTPRAEDNIPQRIKQNCFLQSWSTSSSPRSAQVPELRRMINVGQKYGIRIEGLAFARDILREMPIWHHIQADPRIKRLTNSQASKCLMEKHRLTTVGQAEDLAAPLVTTTERRSLHRRNDRCVCRDCQEVRQRHNCTHPHQCMLRAEELLNTLPQKWDPRREQPEDYEIGPDDHEGPRERNVETFDYRISTTGNLSDIFRIFTDETVPPSDEVLIRKVNAAEGPDTIIATDGSCMNNGQEDATAGAGVFYGRNDARNKSIRLPRRIENRNIIQSNQTAELVAAMEAPEAITKNTQMSLETDSKYVISHLTTSLKKMEDIGYINVNNADIIRTMVARYRLHEAPIHIKWVKGHNGHEGNEAADALAGIAATRAQEDHLDLNIPQTLRITGAKLNALTQKLAYTAIRQRKATKTPDRPRTRAILTQVKLQVQSLFNVIPTDPVIWKSIRSRDLERKTRYFLWMVTNDAYMTGTHWQRANYPDEIKERAICQHDQKTEDITHILVGCESPGQGLIWDMTGRLWERKNRTLQWERPALGTIVGAGLAVFKTPGGARKSGEERLWRILIAESAYLIWRLRCERVIRKDNAPFTTREIENRWSNMINERLQLDRRMTSRKYGKKGISPNLVRATWQGLLDREHTLPDDWVTNSGVLVGIESDLRRQTGPRGR
ncbi:hypothetical protein D9758_009406 [Tetrapyrgos nigripes]|uniref:Reverse transcriptase n=1 Tax=Tetrapyrgos nigripes TaxID=182062 RepID=A0A8H5D216_9AGAR|nr:hypothetical protein D9758_009406 [Tetrapyrgos nigripes]